MKLTKEQILTIPTLLGQKKTIIQIGEQFGVTRLTISYWIKRLKKAGHKIPKNYHGRPSLDLTISQPHLPPSTLSKIEEIGHQNDLSG